MVSLTYHSTKLIKLKFYNVINWSKYVLKFPIPKVKIFKRFFPKINVVIICKYVKTVNNYLKNKNSCMNSFIIYYITNRMVSERIMANYRII